MEFDSSIFRMYDIRGKYPDQFSSELARAIGVAYIRLLKKETEKDNLTIAVGLDTRLSSPELFEAFAEGIVSEGCDVVKVGLVTTPMLYFAVSHYGYDGGAMITASHNPNPYNGIKLTREKAVPLGGETGIFKIRNSIEKSKHEESEDKQKRGGVAEKNIETDYIEQNFELAEVVDETYPSLKVAVDAGNGVGGPIFQKILERVGVEVVSLYMEPDGRFPNHIPDPLQEGNLKDIKELINTEEADLGVALDGDADRIRFLDEHGDAISGDLVTAFVAQIVLREKGKGEILYDVRSSNSVPEAVQEVGGEATPYKVGHALIKEKMRKDSILFSGEYSGHYYWGEGLFYETPFVVFLLVLKELHERGEPLSKLIKPFQKYAHSGEINFEVQDAESILDNIKKEYTAGYITELDGVRIDYKDWWLLVRLSNTEPLLRLIVEAKTEELMKEKVAELSKIISS